MLCTKEELKKTLSHELQLVGHTISYTVGFQPQVLKELRAETNNPSTFVSTTYRHSAKETADKKDRRSRKVVPTTHDDTRLLVRDRIRILVHQDRIPQSKLLQLVKLRALVADDNIDHLVRL